MDIPVGGETPNTKFLGSVVVTFGTVMVGFPIFLLFFNRRMIGGPIGSGSGLLFKLVWKKLPFTWTWTTIMTLRDSLFATIKAETSGLEETK